MFSIKGKTGRDGRRLRKSFSQIDNKMRRTTNVDVSKKLGLDGSFDPKRLSLNSLNFQGTGLKKKLSPLGAAR